MRIPLLLVLTALSISPLQADSLVGFASDGFTKGGPSPWAGDQDGGRVELAVGVVLVEGLQRGVGISAGGTASAWGGNGFNSPDKADAEGREAFFSVTIEPAKGHALSFSAIQSTIFRINESATSYQWQYSLNGGAFIDLGDAVTVIDNSAKGIVQSPVELSGVAAIQKVKAPVTFRMIGWGAEKAQASWGFGRSSGQPVLLFEGTVSKE